MVYIKYHNKQEILKQSLLSDINTIKSLQIESILKPKMKTNFQVQE